VHSCDQQAWDQNDGRSASGVAGAQIQRVHCVRVRAVYDGSAQAEYWRPRYPSQSGAHTLLCRTKEFTSSPVTSHRSNACGAATRQCPSYKGNTRTIGQEVSLVELETDIGCPPV
jgi:hypothetical protein